MTPPAPSAIPNTTGGGVRPEVEALLPSILELRRDLHQHPELGFEEQRTSGRVTDKLRALGLEPLTGIAGTGVAAVIEGEHPGPTLLLRADMDALPVQEETGLPFASQVPGKMHACGHDMHTAILLGAAELLQAARSRLHGRVKLVFQPAEEGPGGALPMIQEGVLQQPQVDFALGLHLWSQEPLGYVGVQAGPMMASADTFRVIVQGRGGHAACPHLCADPIVAAAAMIGSLQTLVSRSTDPFDTAVVSVTRMQAGSADNIIPELAEFGGTIRAFREPVRNALAARLQELVEGQARALGVEARVEYRRGYPPLVNHESMCRWVHSAAAGMGLTTSPFSTMGGEDMAYFLQQVPGAFFFLGAAPEDPALRFPHHHPRFQLHEGVVPIAVEMFLRCAEGALAGA